MKNVFKLLVVLVFSVIKPVTADPVAIHGMFLFGDKTKYLSHLPMFHSPHDYQLITEVELEAAPSSVALTQYEEAIKSGVNFFTIAPSQAFDLTKVIDGTISKFPVNLFEGHFERNGKNLGLIIIAVKNIVYDKKLNPKDHESNHYLFFGKEGEYFAAHMIAGSPSFDTILKIEQPKELLISCGRGDCLTPNELIISDKDLPIKAYSEITEPKINDTLGVFWGFSKILEVLYYEKDELAH